jgi:serine/threonine protein kinase/tetratricopeptide (TPR) repeat protein
LNPQCYASAHNPLHLAAGALVGSYRIIAPLGAGGMGEVYRARDEKLSRDVALKVLSADLASNADHLRRFQQEAHAASATNHPNIITIYDIGRIDETAYIAMELVDGQDLRTMQAGERLPLKTILRIAVKAADGLAAAHERGIVHRDLKPENVMISRDGFVKILDFGLAKLVRPMTQNETTAPHTIPGAVFGTVAYMSPEQAAGRPVDFRSDQFSLGVILYEMLSGRMPFNEASAAETLAAIIRHDAPPIPAVNDVPSELQRIVDRCLAKDPADRYASTRDLARDLREVRDRISNTSEPRHRTDRPPIVRTRRMVWLGGVAGAIVLIAIGVWMAQHPPRPVKVEALQHGPLSLAVLPFRDLSGTADGQIFTDGIAEMIRSRLGESRTIRIIPAFDRDSTGDPPSVARKLGAAFALTGAVQRIGSDVHLSVSLIDANSGVQVAGETLNGTSSDIFGLHNRAVSLILAGMKIRRDDQERAGPAAELSRADDQNAYIEALGLLQRARDEKSVDRAIATLERLLLNARDSPTVNAQLARALFYKSQMSRRPGLIEQATLYAERAAELDDSQPEIHVRLGQLRNAAGRYGDAEREYRRALSLRPDNADAILGLAETNEAMGRAADAEAMYKKAIELRPQHANTYDRYAAFLFNSGRADEAAANFLRSTQLMPTPRGFNNLGGAYQALGRYDAARQAYEKSIALGPNSDAYVNVGVLHYYNGNYAEATRALEQSVALARGSYPAWLALGDAYRGSGAKPQSAVAYENTVKAARDVIAINPRDAVAHAACANALAKLGRSSEAAAAMDKALKLDPTSQNALYSAAVVALLRGTNDVALGWLQRSVSAGYPLVDLQHDPEFKSIRDDPAFPRAAVEKK